MIKFHKVKFKNFLSTGNEFTEIDLSRKKTSLIIGANGSGKSTLLDALTFGLFGRAFRKIPKTALVNSINQKQLVVEVEFQIGRNRYRILRSIKPNKFEIYRDGKLMHQDASVRDYQAILEQQILKLNYKSFTQVVVLGSSTFTPFMQLNTPERRAIIEDILDIQIFSVMKDCLRQRSATLRNEYNEIKTNIRIGESKIQSQEESMKRLEENRDEMIDKLNADVLEHETQVIEHKTNIRADMSNVQTCMNLIQDEDTVRASLQTMLSDEKDFETERRKFIKELKFYEDNDECPTCEQVIESDHKDHICTERTVNIKELDMRLTQHSDSIEKINQRLEEINEVHKEIAESQKLIQKEQNLIDTNEKYIDKVEGQIIELTKQEHTEDDKDKLEKYQKALDLLQGMEADISDQKHYHDLADILLRDSGIKTKIIRQYLPIMNKLINKYLASMEFFVQFELDEEFNEEE